MGHIFLRRKGLGLESIRNIMASMSHSTRIARVDIPRQPIPMASRGDYAFNWGTMASPSGYTIVNHPNAIAKVSNKGRFRDILHTEGLTMLTFTNVSSAVASSSANRGTKYILRPANHFGGNHLIIVDNPEDMRRYWFSGGYASLYVPKTNEYRVFVANGRVVYVVEKIVNDPTAIAWNVNQGGRFVNIRRGDWNLKVVDYAVKAFNLSGLHFGSVDVMVDADGNAYVLEINTAPALRTTDESRYWVDCVAKTFDYMIEHGLDLIPINNSRRVTMTWKHYIHPAVSDDAIISEPTPPLIFDNDVPTDLRDRLTEIVDTITDNRTKTSDFDLSEMTDIIVSTNGKEYKYSFGLQLFNGVYIVTVENAYVKDWVLIHGN